MVNMVKGLRIIYEDNSDGISFIQSFVPFMHDVDKCVARGAALNSSELFLSNLSPIVSRIHLPTIDSKSLYSSYSADTDVK